MEDRNPLVLLLSIPIALCFLCIRYGMEEYIFMPIGKWLGLKTPRSKIIPNSHVPAKWLNGTGDRIYYFYHKTVKTSKMVKFTECCSRCSYYTFMWLYGIIMLLTKPWFWDINECWTNFENQQISWDVCIYGGIQISFYVSLCISQFFDVRRKDFWEMLIHHMVCVLLVCIAWVHNFVRICTLVVIVHDISDIFLEAAKLTKYIKLHLVSSIFIGLFAVVWNVTRIGIYPIWILSHCLQDPSGVLTKHNAYFTFNGLIFVVFALDCFWTILIIKFIIKCTNEGKFKKDIRSDTEIDSDDD